MIPGISLNLFIRSSGRGLNPGRPTIIYFDNATLPRVDASCCWQLRYMSRIVFPLSRTFQSSASR
jgi:hypothetical protein